MEELEHWRGHEKYTIFQAILLHLGKNPVGLSDSSCEEDPQLNYKYIPAKKRFIEAIESYQLLAEVKYLKEVNFKSIPDGISTFGINLVKSTVNTADVKAWLRKSKIPSKFFEESGQPAYLNPEHERYAPKLAVAVYAWLAMEDAGLMKGKNPGQALRKWITKHAMEYTKDKDVFSNTAISECARVANWDPSGGAPKTLG